MERYLLPITALLASTRGVHQEIVFHAHLSSQRISQEACEVSLRVRAGSMLSCEITEARGGYILLQREEAIDALKPLGLLEWYQVSLRASEAEGTHERRLLAEQHGSPWPPTQQIPCRLTHECPALDHASRRVFLLVDGTRSVQQIAHLLGKSPEEIREILRLLQEDHLIAWE